MKRFTKYSLGLQDVSDGEKVLKHWKLVNNGYLDELESVLGPNTLDLVAVVTAKQDAQVNELVLGHF